MNSLVLVTSCSNICFYTFVKITKIKTCPRKTNKLRIIYTIRRWVRGIPIQKWEIDVFRNKNIPCNVHLRLSFAFVLDKARSKIGASVSFNTHFHFASISRLCWIYVTYHFLKIGLSILIKSSRHLEVEMNASITSVWLLSWRDTMTSLR